MKFSLGDLHRISKWFEIVTQYEDLGDEDLGIYDKITDYLDDKGVSGDPNDIVTYLGDSDHEDETSDDEDEKDYDPLNEIGFYDEDTEDE